MLRAALVDNADLRPPSDATEVAFRELMSEPVRNGIYKPKEFHGRGRKIINMGELFDYDVISDQPMRRIEVTDRELEASRVLNGDLLFARRSFVLEGSGKCSIVEHPNEETVFESSIIRARLDSTRADSRFYYYFFRSPAGRARVASIATRTAVSGITGTDLAAIAVPRPSLARQKYVVSVLRPYDDLITVNERRIATLESLATAIFRNWFGSIAFGSAAGRTLPDGWREESLGSILRTLEAGSRPAGGADKIDRDVPSVGAENIRGLGRYDYSKEKFVSHSFFEAMRRGKVQSGDVLLYKDGAYIGRVSVFRDGFPHEVCCVNEHVFILRTDPRCSQTYLYFWLAQPEVTERIRGLNANAAQPGINQPAVRGLPILLPSAATMQRFDAFAEPQLAQMFNLAKTNRLLTQMRDVVLGRMFSEASNNSVRGTVRPPRKP